MCGSRDILTDRQTDTQTCSSQYFATALASEVKTAFINLHSRETFSAACDENWLDAFSRATNNSDVLFRVRIKPFTS